MKKLFVIAMGILLAGCAYNPQQVRLSPAVSVLPSNEGRNVRVAFRVVDERPARVLGRRADGYGSAAAITAAEDVAVVVQRGLMDGLRKKGFNPVEGNEGSGPHLTVEIRLLEYSTSNGLASQEIHVNGALKAIAARGNANYERMYRWEKEESSFIVPTAETNEQWINDVLSNVMNQVLEDGSLMKFLAG